MLTDSERQLLLAEQRTALAGERNKMANERTFLAWVRTGLAGVGGGIAILRILSFTNPTHELISKIIGQSLILWGVAIFIICWLEYYRSYQRLKAQNEVAGSIAYVSVLALTLIVLSLTMFIITLQEHPVYTMLADLISK